MQSSNAAHKFTLFFLISSNAIYKNYLNNICTKNARKNLETSSEVLKCNKFKQKYTSRFDEIGCIVNLTLNYDNFYCLIKSVLLMMLRHSEVSNQFLNTVSELEALAVAIILHLHES